jgi:two-component system CheB/CheR fusion protein
MSLPPALAAARSDDVLTAAVLQVVRERVGLDFSEYRPATIERRIRNRMLAVGAACLSEYLQRLTAAPDEAEALAERLVIKVSRFYRNAATFDLLRSTVVPALVAEAHGAPLRVWCAGCSGGEEAYTYAMLLEEAGVAGTIEATDIACDALAAAAAGTYRLDALNELPEDLAVRYLQPLSGRAEERYRVVDALRARVRFTRHDVTTGPLPGTF